MRRRFDGLGVAPGVAIGSVVLLHAEELPVVVEPIPPERVAQEISAFHEARQAARGELDALRERVLAALGDRYAGILEAQLLILDDPRLIEQTEQRIRLGRVSARWALRGVVGEYARRLAAVDDQYLRERGGDLDDLHRRVQRLLRGEAWSRERVAEGPLIAVAHNLGPSDAVDLARRGVVGLATDVGGRTSHTAILAQALGVPAVAGLRDMSQVARPGDPVIVDGDRGEALLLPSADELGQASQRRALWLAREEHAAVEAAPVPARTRDGVEVTLRANIEFVEEVSGALRFGAQGIGLYRSEFLFLRRSPGLPDEDEHHATYAGLARAVAPHPAVVRTFDLGGEKYFHQVLEHEGANPVLGLRAVRFCLRRPDVFRPQLRGLLRAATESNLRVMLPLVTTVDEVREVRRRMRAEAESLRGAGVAVRDDVPVGIMIEVPAAALAARELAAEADFFSIGTNDLIQYALAVDRGNEMVSYLYQPRHPGVLRLLRNVVDAADRSGIPVSVCGEMAADPATVDVLIGLGLRELSVQPRALPLVREALRQLDSQEAARRAEEALR